MAESLPNRDKLIFREMMAHTPLFAHRNPQQIAIAGDEAQEIVQEVLKHVTIKTIHFIGNSNTLNNDTKIKLFAGNLTDFVQQANPNSLDIMILGDQALQIDPSKLIPKFHPDGILIQLCDSPFELAGLKAIQNQFKSAGFEDVLILNFPQPRFVSGWRSAIMAIKEGNIKRPRERDIFNKTFSTRYYNLDMHRAAFALPEFMREELVD